MKTIAMKMMKMRKWRKKMKMKKKMRMSIWILRIKKNLRPKKSKVASNLLNKE